MEITGNVLMFPMIFILLYFLLEAGEWGLMTAAPHAARTKQERSALLNLCRPGLDGNELWLFSGMYLLSQFIPQISQFGGTACVTIFAVLAVIGMILRTVGGWLNKSLNSSFFIQINAFISLFTVVFFGLSLGSLVSGIQEGFLTHFGIIFALWMAAASFQTGTLWGAVKIENPLAERLRASFLVSSLVSILFFIILVIMMYSETELSSQSVICFIVSLILNGASFYFARKRSVALSLGVFIVSLLLACVFILGNSLFLIPSEFAVAASQGMTDIVPAAVLAAAVIWTGASFIYRLARGKIKYAWEDHI
jgi:cytochrome d ubiquinol oxidase subunit II